MCTLTQAISMTKEQERLHKILKTAIWWINTEYKIKLGNCYGLNYAPSPQIHMLKC